MQPPECATARQMSRETGSLLCQHGPTRRPMLIPLASKVKSQGRIALCECCSLFLKTSVMFFSSIIDRAIPGNCQGELFAIVYSWRPALSTTHNVRANLCAICFFPFPVNRQLESRLIGPLNVKGNGKAFTFLPFYFLGSLSLILGVVVDKSNFKVQESFRLGGPESPLTSWR